MGIEKLGLGLGLAILLAITSSVSAQNGIEGNITVDVEVLNFPSPVEIVSIEKVAGSWTYKNGLIVVGFKLAKLMNFDSIDMFVEYRNAGTFNRENLIKGSVCTQINEEIVNCSVCRKKYRSDYQYSVINYELTDQLVPGKIYHAVFFYPTNPSDGVKEFNHIVMSVNDDGRHTGENVWIYRSNGDVPNAGKDWMPKGILVSDYANGLLLNKTVSGWVDG